MIAMYYCQKDNLYYEHNDAQHNNEYIIEQSWNVI